MSSFNIENRRYVGSKAKLIHWIKPLIMENCKKCSSFFDVFAGTSIISYSMLNEYKDFYINDLLYSNEIIYKAFYQDEKYDKDKIEEIKESYNNIINLKDNYVSDNYGDKFFSYEDAKKIGYIRDNIEELKSSNKINSKEYYMLIASLMYSFDKIANTVGHYEAYRKNTKNFEEFKYDLIKPIEINNQNIRIFREDANSLAKKVKADIAFVDPPYNSRQYSRFYHLLENIANWNKPKLYGTAMKPVAENMSEYCRNSAPIVFEDLILNLRVSYIVVTYNNTYNSKSSSSKNKIELEQIENSLYKRGIVKKYEIPYKFFNAGKSDLKDHKEILYIVEVRND